MSPLSENSKESLQAVGDKSHSSADLHSDKSRNNSTGAGDSSSETWYGELLHSTAYALIQNPYNSARQIENHVSHALVNKSFLPQVEFISPLHERHDGSAIAMAQTIGNLAGNLPYFVGAEMLIRKSLPDELMARTLSIVGDSSKRVLSTAAAGAVVEGIINPSDDNGDWMNARAKRAAVAFTTFAVAGAATEGLMSNSIARGALGSMPTESITDRLLKNGLTRVHNFSVGAVGGAAGGATGVELNSLITEGKIASASDVVNGSLKTAAMMGTLASLRGSSDLKSGNTRKSELAEGLPVKNTVDLPSQLPEMPQLGKISPQAMAENIPPPVPEFSRVSESKVKPASDQFSVSTDPEQIAKMEGSARRLASEQDYHGSARFYAAVIDSWEGLKSVGRRVDEVHLSQLYRDLAGVKLNGDKP